MFHKSAHISANKENFHKIFCYMIVHGYRVNLQQKTHFRKISTKVWFSQSQGHVRRWIPNFEKVRSIHPLHNACGTFIPPYPISIVESSWALGRKQNTPKCKPGTTWNYAVMYSAMKFVKTKIEQLETHQ